MGDLLRWSGADNLYRKPQVLRWPSRLAILLHSGVLVFLCTYYTSKTYVVFLVLLIFRSVYAFICRHTQYALRSFSRLLTYAKVLIHACVSKIGPWN